MAVSRTIYTQGAVSISGSGILNRFLTGVQSANYSVSEPKQDVNAFGVLGSINKVQLEPIGATAEIQFVIERDGSGLFPYFNSGILPYLIASSKLPNPQYYDITISGIGQVKSGVLSYFTIEAAEGAVPTITVRFEGQSGVPVSAGALPTSPNTGTVFLLVPQSVTGIYYADGSSTCAQSVRLAWEMPVERLNCLGNAIDATSVFTRPPGTTTITMEGTTHPGLISGLDFGNYGFRFTNLREISLTNNLAIGDAFESFSSTQETNGLSLTIIEPIYTNQNWTSDLSNNSGVLSGNGTSSFYLTGTTFSNVWIVDTGIRVQPGEWYRVSLGFGDDDSGVDVIAQFGVLTDSNVFVAHGVSLEWLGASESYELGKQKIGVAGRPGWQFTSIGTGVGSSMTVNLFDKYLQG